MWFFVPEEEFRPTLETYAAWVKEFKLEESPIKVRREFLNTFHLITVSALP